MTAAISINNVKKSYGSLDALKGVDLTINRGEFFGLLGPNGAGKSTLINIIAGLANADAGSVSVLGHDVVGDYRQARQALGVVPQELVFDAFFSVREVLKIQSGYFGLGRENDAWIDELLEALALTDKADVNMRALSGGMKRRVLIAQALVHKPEVVILDEPTAGVDVELRKLLWNFVEQLNQKGHTIVLTTHYLEEAEKLCDQIAILNHGEVIALDTKASLLQSEICNKLHLIIKTAEPMAQLPDALSPSIRDKVKHLDGCQMRLELHKDKDVIVDVLAAIADAGIKVVDLETERADLEDVFVELTSKKASS
ncbi:MAG: ABC transporter ATP-binding protein [Thiotrichaceae bacterium]|nr:ABC transporter ATP-binding protein [Thiotrichaceae bacterium]